MRRYVLMFVVGILGGILGIGGVMACRIAVQDYRDFHNMRLWVIKQQQLERASGQFDATPTK